MMQPTSGKTDSNDSVGDSSDDSLIHREITSHRSTTPSDLPNLAHPSLSLFWRFFLAGCLVLISLLVGAYGITHWHGYDRIEIWLILGVGVVLLWASLLKFVLNPMLALFRTLESVVHNYRDKQYNFGLYWKYQDELSSLVQAHNALSHTISEQRVHLVQREFLLDSLLQHSPIATILVDVKGYIVFANLSARKIFYDGKKCEGLLFQNLLILLPESFQQAFSQNSDSVFIDIKPHQDNDDTLFIQEDIYHLNQRQFQLQGSVHQLYQLRQLTTEIRRQEVQTWKKLIRVMSHELNNSLAPISSLVHSSRSLLDRQQYDRLPEILDLIAERTQHLHDFILSYGHIAKLPHPQLKPVAWADFLRKLKLQWMFKIQGDIPHENVSIDEVQFEQALLNILKNAHESGSSVEQISVEVQSHLQYFILMINDAGTGMNETVLANAMLPFYSTKRQGTGIGLALCREIVEAHGGNLLLHNREQNGEVQGLCVKIILPK